MAVKKLLLSFFFFLGAVSLLFSQTQRQSMGYEVFDQWRNIHNQSISYDGNIISWEVKPELGDGWLYIHNAKTNKTDSIRNACCARISPKSNFIVYRTKLGLDSLRALKLAKTKDEDFPGDTLVVRVFGKDSLYRFSPVKTIKMAEESSNWIAFTYDPKKMPKPVEVKDSTSSEEKTKPKPSKKKKETENLIFFNPITQQQHSFEDVAQYTLSKTGNMYAIVSISGDSIDSLKVQVFYPEQNTLKTVFNRTGKVPSIAIDDQGEQLAFSFSSDTTDRKLYSLFYMKKDDSVRMIADTTSVVFPDNYAVSEHADMYFTENQRYLVFGTAPKPPIPSKDSIPDDEKPVLDVWTWKDKRLMSQQLAELKKDKEKSYVAIYNTETGRILQLETDLLDKVHITSKTSNKNVLATHFEPYRELISWEYPAYKDVYIINIENAERTLLLEKHQYHASISPDANYVLYWSTADSLWYSINLQNKQHSALTSSVPYPMYDEEYDVPGNPRPYGLAGWYEKDESVLVYDKYDIWALCPKNEKAPLCLTHNKGRELKSTYRYIQLDADEKSIGRKANLFLHVFNHTNKTHAYAFLQATAKKPPQIAYGGEFQLVQPRKAKYADILIFRRSNFSEYPDIWYSQLNFKNPKKISHCNPQQSNYLWGSSELVSWTSPGGKELEGIIYKPENFDKDKHYPMLVYFYDRSSMDLYRYQSPRATPSIIQPSFYTSNGYLVFIPDIKYDIPLPGQSAYDAIISGTEYIVSQGFVDKSRIGIQGQSWGGYQVAYLITQTDMFAAAMAGAPVSNMTSAYGGIRWEKGVSRMFQYEEGQSRIGKNLWEDRDAYIYNSPLFFVDKINTPLLIMHNDGDGAVPWYQSIELFTAMRRLQKPVWWLNYNKDEHNLMKHPNRRDLSIRMFAFFEYYLKGKPEPQWMREGIPATLKGLELRYD